MGASVKTSSQYFKVIMAFCHFVFCKHCNEEIQQAYTKDSIVWEHVNNKNADHEPEPKPEEED